MYCYQRSSNQYQKEIQKKIPPERANIQYEVQVLSLTIKDVRMEN